MQRNITSLYGYVIRAKDGDIGHVHEFLFEDNTWEIKYLVVDTGIWIFGRKVLLTPAVLGEPDWATQTFPVSLIREQVRSSPDIDTDKPVSDQQLSMLHQYYAWPVYMAGTGIAYEPMILPPLIEKEEEEIDKEKHKNDPHLRSTRNVSGYSIETRDGEIGHGAERLAGKKGLIKPHLVIARCDGQPHIGRGRTTFPFTASSAGTTLLYFKGCNGLVCVVRRGSTGNRLGDRPQIY